MFFLQISSGETEPLGVLLLNSRGVFAQSRWYWIGVAALVGYIFLFNFFYTLALAYLKRRCPVNSSRCLHIFVDQFCSSKNFVKLLQHWESLREFYPKKLQ